MSFIRHPFQSGTPMPGPGQIPAADVRKAQLKAINHAIQHGLDPDETAELVAMITPEAGDVRHE